jgi:tetratricopeptide (TPR) repeat protein
LSLEPLAEPKLSDERQPPIDDEEQRQIDSGIEPVSEPQIEPLSSPADAAGVMRANEARSYSAVDWARDHYMITFLASAALVAIFYGLYVYIQISNPALFRAPPPPVPAPMQTAAAPATMAASEPPQVSGMPDSNLPAAEQRQNAMAGPVPAANADASRPPQQAGAGSTNQANSSSEIKAAVSAEQQPPSNVRPAAPARQRSAQRAAPAASAESRTYSDGVEVVEIPASPSIAALPQPEKPTNQRSIEVQRQDTGLPPIDPQLIAAYEALQLGNYEQAATLYGKVLVRAPANTDAMLGLAAIAWKQGRPDAASGYYASVLELDPRNTHAQAGLIAILGNADPVAAETRLKELIGREPSAFLYFTLGNLYADRKLWSQAQHAYFQAYQLNPDNPDYAFNLAVGLEHLGQSRPALDYYRKALDLSFRKGRANFDQERAIERVGQLSARVK